MALIKDGYFQDTYWASRYWQEDYWAEYGTPAVVPKTYPQSAHGLRHKPTFRHPFEDKEFIKLMIEFVEII